MQRIKDDEAALENEVSENEKTKRKIEILKRSINAVINISPEEIKLKNNVRHKVDEGSQEFKQLCESIKTFGLMKNVVAELKISQEGDSYELICVAGHRRLTALKKLGNFNKVPCLIKSYQQNNKGERVGAALSENLIREGLSCVDIANGYKELSQAGWSDEELVKHFEKTKSTIHRYLRVAELPDDIKSLIRDNPEKLSTRVVFRDILAKGDSNSDIRKLVKRKIESKRAPNIKSKKNNMKDKLNEFFKEHEYPDVTKDAIIKAFQYVGIWK